MRKEESPEKDFLLRLAATWEPTSNPILVLSESWIRARALRVRVQELSGQRNSQTRRDSQTHRESQTQCDEPSVGKGAFQFLPRSEWFSSLAKEHLPAGSKLLERTSALGILLTLLQRDSQDFPCLFEELHAQRGRPQALTQLLSQLRNFFELLRASQFGSVSLRSLVDEWGNTTKGRERVEEEFQLFLRYEEYLQEEQLLDHPALLTHLRHVLGEREARSLPKTLLIDTPWSLSPLEVEILGALSEQLELKLLLAPQMSPGAELLLQHPEWFTEIHTLPSKSGEGMKALSDPLASGRFTVAEELSGDFPIEVLVSPGREEEIRLVLHSVKESLGAGELLPSEVHLLSSELDAYREGLLRVAEELSLPIQIGKPFSLRETAAGRMFLAYTEWLAEPTLRTLESFLSHPFSIHPALQRESILTFFEKSELELWNELSEEARESLLQVPAQNSLRVLREFAERYGYLSTQFQAGFGESPGGQHLLRRVRKDRSLLEALPGLALFVEAWRAREAFFHEGPGGRIKKLTQRFQKQRKRLKSLRGSPFVAGTELEEQVQAFRALSRVSRLAREREREFEFLAEGAWPEREDYSLLLESQLLQSALSEVTLTPVSEKSRESILVTEFLDARSTSASLVFVLGCVDGIFPAKARHSLHFLHETESRKEEVRATQEPRSTEEEGEQLLAHLLLAANEVVFTFPAESASATFSPAPAIRFLASLHPSQRKLSLARLALARPGSQVVSAPGADWLHLAQRSIQGRRAKSWTLYDGDLRGEATVSRELLPREYSASLFEDIADCRKRFYFRNLLRLPEDQGTFFQILSSDYGSLVHQILAEFYRDPRMKELLAADFSLACNELFKISQRVLKQTERSWESNVYERYRRKQLLEGLREGNPETKRGTLIAALYYQALLLPTWPAELETQLRFTLPVLREEEGEGGGGAQREPEEFGLRVIVDRLDQEGEGENLRWSVWDYKTGIIDPMKDQKAGRSLQLPIYAEAVRRCLNPHRVPRRGGIFDLGHPNKGGEKLDHIVEGILRERLAVKYQGRSYVFDLAEVESRVEEGIAAVRRLELLLRSGDFRQDLSTEHCSYCSFSRSCFRDELLLERKLDEEAKDEDPVSRSSEVAPFGRVHFEERKLRHDPPLSPEQERACDITKSIALRAGAGSGKTFVLRTRFLRLLLAGEPIESIVAITFTERAAAEIRERIELAIRNALATGVFSGVRLDDAQRECLQKAQKSIHRAHIGTIHSFAAQLLRLGPDLAGLFPYRNVISGAERNALIDLALHEIEKPGADVESHMEALLDSGLSPNTLRLQLKKYLAEPREFDLVLETFRRDGQEGSITPFLRRKWSERVEQEESLFLEYLLPFSEELRDWLDRGNARELLLEEEIETFRKLLAQIRSFTNLLGNGTTLPWFDAYFSLLGTLQAEKGLTQKMRTKSKYPKNFWMEVRDVIAEKAKVVSILSRPLEMESLGFAMLIDLASCVLAARRKFQEIKEARESIDFQDLIAGAKHLVLQRDSGLRQARRERLLLPIRTNVRHLMVDEFQDTDPEQWDLLRSLFLDSPDARLQSLFLVGDNQQAIYSFRGGDVRVFEQASLELERRGGERASLEDNYRSHPRIIEFCNTFFETLFSVDFSSSGEPLQGAAVRSQRLVPRVAEGIPQENAPKRILLLDTNSEETRKKKGSLGGREEAEAVARFVERVLSELESDAKGAGPAYWPGLQAEHSQIAILTRTGNDLARVRSALFERKIPFELGKNSGFFDLPEIQSVRLLLSLLVDPEDEVSLVGVLRSPFVGLDDAELLRLRKMIPGKFSGFWLLNLEPGPLREAQQLLLNLRSGRTTAKLSSLLERTLAQSPLVQAFSEEGSPEARENISRFLEQLRDVERRLPGGGSPAEIGRWLDTLEDSSAPATVSSGEKKVTVTLMTVHAAKGLEFGMVLLPFLKPYIRRDTDFLIGEFDIAGNLPPSAFGGNLLGIRVEDESKEFRREKTFVHLLIEEAAEAKRAAEERRLFYVACTRAEEYLVLSGQNIEHEKRLPKSIVSEEERLSCYLSSNPAEWVNTLGFGPLQEYLPAISPD